MTDCKYCGGTGVDPENMKACPDCKTEQLEKAKETAVGMLEKLRTPEDVTVEDLEKMLKEIRELRRKLKSD